jgi:hypothetical protein
MKVICNKASSCKWHREEKKKGFGCSAAEPHEKGRCVKCHIVKSAKCVPVKEKEEMK